MLATTFRGVSAKLSYFQPELTRRFDGGLRYNHVEAHILYDLHERDAGRSAHAGNLLFRALLISVALYQRIALWKFAGETVLRRSRASRIYGSRAAWCSGSGGRFSLHRRLLLISRLDLSPIRRGNRKDEQKRRDCAEDPDDRRCTHWTIPLCLGRTVAK